MKKIIRLTETDLVRLVKRVIKETSEPGFSAWLEENTNTRGSGSYCIKIQEVLDSNNYRNNHDAAPEEFKRLVRTSNCFYNSSSGGLQSVQVKKAMQMVTDEATKTLLGKLSQNKF